MKEIILIGAGQAFFFAIFLFRKNKRSFADQLLGTNLIVAGFQLSTVVMQLNGLEKEFHFLTIWNCGLPLLSAFLYYYYAKALAGRITKPNKQFRRGLLLVLSGNIIYLLPLLPMYLFSENLFSASSSPIWDLLSTLINIVNLSAYGTSIFLSLRILHQHHLLLPRHYSNTENLRLGWLQKWLIFALGSYTLGTGGYLLTFLFDLSIDFSNTINGIYASLGIFTLGYFGMKQGMPTPICTASKEEETKPETNHEPRPRYKNQLLTTEQANDLRLKIEACISEEKPHLTENITIGQLARRINIPINQLSQYLNAHLNQNFYDFINSLRIEEVKEMIKAPSKAHLSLLGIALECGFSSKATFNRSFKKYTGMTPSEYTRTLKNRDQKEVQLPI